jgi:hypothetical protein
MPRSIHVKNICTTIIFVLTSKFIKRKDSKVNEPAFPTGTGVTPYKSGMTLRDYFAAQAMQGMFASGNLPQSVQDDELAFAAYKMADAMMKAREA